MDGYSNSNKNNRSFAVLMTCHNRRVTTLQCLEKLEEQTVIEDIEITIYLVDDGSTDGTSEAIRDRFPNVNIIEGDGSLYWTGGMRLAMKKAVNTSFDFYLWLNDDVTLYSDAIEKILESYFSLSKSYSKEIIVGGALCGSTRGEVSYGGYRHSSSWHPLRFELLSKSNKPQKCDALNGNLVFIPSQVIDKIGILHSELKHGIGDFEYTLRATKNGIGCWVAPGLMGKCPRNSIKNTWKDTSLSLSDRYRKLLNVKGEPFYERYIFVSEYGGTFWPIIFISVYFRPLIDYIYKKYDKTQSC